MRRGSRNRAFLIFIFTFSLFFIVVNNIRDAKSAPVSSQNPILFVHGYSGDASNWNTMKLHFYYDGWSGEILRAFTFSDNWNGTSEGNIVNAKSIEIC